MTIPVLTSQMRECISINQTCDQCSFFKDHGYNKHSLNPSRKCNMPKSIDAYQKKNNHTIFNINRLEELGENPSEFTDLSFFTHVFTNTKRTRRSEGTRDSSLFRFNSDEEALAFGLPDGFILSRIDPTKFFKVLGSTKTTLRRKGVPILYDLAQKNSNVKILFYKPLNP
jgi:hypothetical protein